MVCEAARGWRAIVDAGGSLEIDSAKEDAEGRLSASAMRLLRFFSSVWQMGGRSRLWKRPQRLS